MTNLFEIDFIVDFRIFSIYLLLIAKKILKNDRDYFIKAQTIRMNMDWMCVLDVFRSKNVFV